MIEQFQRFRKAAEVSGNGFLPMAILYDNGLCIFVLRPKNNVDRVTVGRFQGHTRVHTVPPDAAPSTQ